MFQIKQTSCYAFSVQIGVDENDQNAAQNVKGSVEAVFTPDRDSVSPTPLAPYSEVFGLQVRVWAGLIEIHLAIM